MSLQEAAGGLVLATGFLLVVTSFVMATNVSRVGEALKGVLSTRAGVVLVAGALGVHLGLILLQGGTFLGFPPLSFEPVGVTCPVEPGGC